MKIDKKLISDLENLARLELSGEESDNLAKDLNNILNMVMKLEDLETDHVEALVYLTEKTKKFRSDDSKQIISKEEALKNGPQTNADFFMVPKMVKKK